MLYESILFVALLIDCPSVPVSDAERAAIIQSAHNARPDDLTEIDFESVLVTKCISYWEWDEPEKVRGRTERIRFYGLFPHNVESGEYRERHSIRCYRSVDYKEDVVFDQSGYCEEELERYMKYKGLDREIRLRGTVSVEDATAYLDYLLSYDFGKDARTRIGEMLQRIQSVYRTHIKGKLRFSASFNHGACATTSFETLAVREEQLIFGEVGERTIIC